MVASFDEFHWLWCVCIGPFWQSWETIATSTFLIDAAKIRFSSSVVMRFVTIVWIREIKLAKIIFLCLILKFEEIFPKNRKLSPKDKIISPINRKISPKDKMISPKENCLLIIYHGTDCCRWFSVAYRTGFLMWFLWGEGWRVYFKLYIIFFF